MAFQLPPLPNFNVQIPDLQQKALEGAQLRNMMSEMALRQQLAPLQIQQQQQQVQAGAIQNTLAQMKLDSNKKLMDLVAGGLLDKFTGKNANAPEGSAFDATGATAELARQGIMLEVAQPLIEHFQNIDKATSEIAKNYGTAAADHLKNRATAHSQLAASLDDAAHSENPAGVIPSIIARYLKDPQGLSPDEIKGLQSLQGLSGDALAKTAALMASALNLGAEMDRHHAETAQKAAESKAAEQKVIPTGAGAVSPETQQQIQKDIAIATNPQIQQGKEAVARAEGEARANIEARIARGSSAALANVPPHLVPAASADATKAGTEYAQAKSVSDRLQAMMDAARKGNVVSYQLIPEEGALQVTTSQGVHRINMAEIQNYGGGSLWQRMQGHIGKALTGESIPKSVLDDMADMQDIQSRGSQAKYENTLKTINQTYGADFKPVQMEGLKPAADTPPSPAAAGMKWQHRTVNGKVEWRQVKQ